MADAMKDIIFNGSLDVATAFFAQSCRMMHKIAVILGRDADAKEYAELYEKSQRGLSLCRAAGWATNPKACLPRSFANGRP